MSCLGTEGQALPLAVKLTAPEAQDTHHPWRGGAGSLQQPPLSQHVRRPQAIFFGGMDMSLRGEVWPFLREALRAQKHQEDVAIQQGR